MPSKFNRGRQLVAVACSASVDVITKNERQSRERERKRNKKRGWSVRIEKERRNRQALTGKGSLEGEKERKLVEESTTLLPLLVRVS